IKVRIEFANPKDELKDGMSAVLQVLNAQSGENVIIPYRAVVEQMGEFFVFVAKDTIAEQRKIHLGPKMRDLIVVTDGLKSGEVVVTDGFQRLRDGGTIDTSGVPKQTQQAPGQAPKK
ncbi:MAG: efflux transporter, family, subunit, partial [Bacteroidetes bacterium]|nr:efflux transporter, family, subunit [Bacteroidota bacterium]